MSWGAGSPSPLGATIVPGGVNFAVASTGAELIELCLFSSRDDRAEQRRLPLTKTGGIWHIAVPDVAPGQLYGYRAHGPWRPATGDRYNPAKLLLDPYARVIGRTPVDHPSLFAYEEGSSGDGAADRSDSAPYAPLGAVASDAFDWQGDVRPGTPWCDTVVYELHVKGFTALHGALAPAERGTYAGLASAAAVAHLRALGVTAVELLPIQAHADEWQLSRRGLTNYWGYNTLGFFAPDPRFAISRDPLEAAREFKTMVRGLHAAGIEVILDVVYNHSAEGDHLGPHLSLRGLDNRGYYRLEPGALARYQNFSGCGNTLDLRSDLTRTLVLDSLRYWIEEMHVDGFRFDLATALARGEHGFDPGTAFLQAVRTDPVISRVKLIAEPWDAAPDGFHLGAFGAGWAEWNARYRDTVRRFWRGDGGQVSALATRLSGSSDVFAPSGRPPQASLNYVTAHDGFTLADLVAYTDRHNDANGENNRDGEAHNFSWNHGVEGPTDRPDIAARRLRQQKNLLLTLFTSLGVPMISGGDELGRTQSGNNNPYNQDSPLTWTHWPGGGQAAALLTFVRRLAGIRAAHPALRRPRFLAGRAVDPPDTLWLRPDGQDMTDADWQDPDRRTLGWLLAGSRPAHAAPPGAPHAEPLLILLHAGDRDLDFQLPAAPGGWQMVIDTVQNDADQDGAIVTNGTWRLAPQSAAVLRGIGRADRPAPPSTGSSAAAPTPR